MKHSAALLSQTSRLRAAAAEQENKITPDASSFLTRFAFLRPVRTLRTRQADGHWSKRTSAMSAGLTDYAWPLADQLALTAVPNTTLAGHEANRAKEIAQCI